MAFIKGCRTNGEKAGSGRALMLKGKYWLPSLTSTAILLGQRDTRRPSRRAFR